MNNVDGRTNRKLRKDTFLEARWIHPEQGTGIDTLFTFEHGVIEDEFNLGIILGIIAKHMLEGLRISIDGNPALMEQAVASMHDGFKEEISRP